MKGLQLRGKGLHTTEPAACKWMHACIFGECMHVWMHAFMVDACMYGRCMDSWMNACMHAWWMDACMADACMYGGCMHLWWMHAYSVARVMLA